MHLWVEPRELVDAPPALRGRASAIDSEHEVAFADFSELQGFMEDELAYSGLLDTGSDSSGEPSGGRE